MTGIEINIEKILWSLGAYLWTSSNNKQFYGLAYRNFKSVKGRSVEIAEIYDTTLNGYREVQFDDRKDAICFFDVKNTISNARAGQLPFRNVRLIFAVNLESVYPNYDGRNTEQAYTDVLAILHRYHPGACIVSEVFTGLEAYGDLYTENLKAYNMHPWHVFGIECEIRADYSCNVTNSQIPVFPEFPVTIRNSNNTYSETFLRSQSPFNIPDSSLTIQQNGADIATITQPAATNNSYEIVPDLNPINVIVRYSNGVIAQTFENEPAGVDLDLTTGIFPPYEPELLAKIAYAEANAIPLPTALDLAKENNFIFLQKQAGNLVNAKGLYWFRGTGTLDWKKINIIDPNKNITWFGGMTSSLSGVVGNGTNAYGDTGILTTTDLDINNASVRFYQENIANAALGAILITSVRIFGSNSTANRFGTGTISAPSVDFSGVGYRAVIRNDAIDPIELTFQIGENFTTREGSNLAVLTNSLLLFRSVNGYSTGTLGFMCIGESISQAQGLAERTAYLASL